MCASYVDVIATQHSLTQVDSSILLNLMEAKLEPYLYHKQLASMDLALSCTIYLSISSYKFTLFLSPLFPPQDNGGMHHHQPYQPTVDDFVSDDAQFV